MAIAGAGRSRATPLFASPLAVRASVALRPVVSVASIASTEIEIVTTLRKYGRRPILGLDVLT